MTKIIYTAIDNKGQEQTNYIKADTNKQAIEQLKSQGFTHITLHDDAASGVFENEFLEGKTKGQLKRMAKFALIAKKDSSLISLLKENLIMNWWFILIGVIIASFGYFQNRHMTLVFGILFIVLLPLISIWRHRHGKRFRRILDYYTFGEWDKALKEIKIHRKFKRFPEHFHDLDFREASILAKTGKIKQALMLVKKWQNTFEQTNPGYYEGRLSVVFDSAGDNQMCLKLMRDCYNKSNDTNISSIDLAMTEARYGDYNESLNFISEINIERLPVNALPYLDWIRGVVAKQKQQNTIAKNFLENALVALLERQGEVLSEINIAECSGELAIVLNRLGETDNALQLISNVSTVLKAHGYKTLIKEISEFTTI